MLAERGWTGCGSICLLWAYQNPRQKKRRLSSASSCALARSRRVSKTNASKVKIGGIPLPKLKKRAEERGERQHHHRSQPIMSRPNFHDQGDYELVSSKSNPKNHVIDVEDDTEVEEDVSEPRAYKPAVVYRSPYCHERLVSHFRKHWIFTIVFLIFSGLMCLSILALVSFIPDCTFKKDDGNDRYERALYADIRPRPGSIPLVNTSTVNGTILLEQFYTQYYRNITSKTYRIALLGDSLVGGLYITYDIKTMLQLYLPMFNFEIIPFDVSGSRIADIRSRLDKVIEAKPDGTFLFFDSDCYDIDEYLLSRTKVSEIRDAYRTNLEYVLSTLISSNPNGFVALGGPSIGECRVSD